MVIPTCYTCTYQIARHTPWGKDHSWHWGKGRDERKKRERLAIGTVEYNKQILNREIPNSTKKQNVGKMTMVATYANPITKGLFPAWFISCLASSNPFIWRQVVLVLARCSMRVARAAGPRVAHSVLRQSRYFLWLSKTSLARVWENSPRVSKESLAMVVKLMDSSETRITTTRWPTTAEKLQRQQQPTATPRSADLRLVCEEQRNMSVRLPVSLRHGWYSESLTTDDG